MRSHLLLALSAGLGLACADVCECPLGTICTEGGECVPECTADAECVGLTCGPDDDPCCSERVACQAGRCVVPTLDEAVCGDPIWPPEGWEAPPGSGPVFIVNRIGFSDSGGVDLDGRCDEGGCIDNQLGALGAIVNDQLRQALLGGETLFAIELAGLDEDYQGFDRSLTVKIHPVHDADDPFFPANNFGIPPGHQTCCEFVVQPAGLDADGHARAQLPAQIRNGRLFTLEVPAPLELTVALGTPPHPVFELAVPQMQAFLPDTLDRLDAGLLSGAFTARSLAAVPSPYCRPNGDGCTQLYGGSLLDVCNTLTGQADIDLDGDGIECVYDSDGDGGNETCCDGAGAAQCPAIPCASPLPASERGCAAASSDGFSASLALTGLPATLLGVRPR